MIRKLWQGLKSLRRGDSNPGWEFEERRELVRLRCHLEVDYTVGSKRYSGQIVDMSLGGMMLRCFQPPGVASMTDVTYKVTTLGVKETTVRCRVQWCKPRQKDFVQYVGLSYHSGEDVLKNSWVKVVLRDLGFRPDRIAQRRKYVRANCVIPVRLVAAGVNMLEGRLYNLGAKGALVECMTSLDKGKLVDLEVGPYGDMQPLQLSGRVVSTQERNRLHFQGIEFEKLNARGQERLGEYLRSLFDEETGG